MMRTHRRLLSAAAPAVLLAVLITGCGTEGDGDSDVRGEDASQTPTPTADSTDSTDEGSTTPGSGDFEEVAILHGSAEGGETTKTPVVLDSQEAVDGFVAAFNGRSLAQEVQSTYDATDVPEGKALLASVISIGCDVPPGVNVIPGADGPQIVAQKVASPMQECLAAVTSVALVLVDAETVG
ncbi:hypothetical protein ASG90_07045 [Nocardioides sp. Soil797]|nr:hypothetical protein ASG90_07045 [Nocardioides sp. Soil797]